MTAAASTPLPSLRVAHVVRPAQGGMVSQVRTLLVAMPDVERLLAAPEEVARALAGVWPPELVSDRDTTPLYVVAPPPVNPPDLLRHGDLVGRWAQAKGATLLHGHGLLWTPLFAAAAHRARIPLVVTLHNLVPPPSELSLVQKVALRAALGRATRIIAVSDAVAQSARLALAGGSTADRVRVVRNGIDTAPFENGPTREEARRALALPPDAPVAVCLARLSPEKGVADLVDAATCAKTPNLIVLIAGDGPERDALARRIEATGLIGRVLLLGRRDDVPRLLRAADVAVVPSREEGLGLAAVEAMAAGVPVIATEAGGLPEVVTDGCGVLVPPGDPDALAEALDVFLSPSLVNPGTFRMFGIAGRERVRSCFTAERMAAETRAVYAEALAEGMPGVRRRRGIAPA